MKKFLLYIVCVCAFFNVAVPVPAAVASASGTGNSGQSTFAQGYTEDGVEARGGTAAQGGSATGSAEPHGLKEVRSTLEQRYTEDGVEAHRVAAGNVLYQQQSVSRDMKVVDASSSVEPQLPSNKDDFYQVRNALEQQKDEQKPKAKSIIQTDSDLWRFILVPFIADKLYDGNKINGDITGFILAVYPELADEEEKLLQYAQAVQWFVKFKRKYTYVIDRLKHNVKALSLLPKDAPIVAKDGEFASLDPYQGKTSAPGQYNVRYNPYKYLEYDAGETGEPVRRRDKNYVGPVTNTDELVLALLQFDIPGFYRALKNLPRTTDGSGEVPVDFGGGVYGRLLLGLSEPADEPVIHGVFDIQLPDDVYINADYFNESVKPQFFLSEDVENGHNIKSYQLYYPLAAGVVKDGKAKRLWTGRVRFPVAFERVDVRKGLNVKGVLQFEVCSVDGTCRMASALHSLNLKPSERREVSMYYNYIEQSFARLPAEREKKLALTGVVFAPDAQTLTVTLKKSGLASSAAVMVEDKRGTHFINPRYRLDDDGTITAVFQAVAADGGRVDVVGDVAVSAVADETHTLRTVFSGASGASGTGNGLAEYLGAGVYDYKTRVSVKGRATQGGSGVSGTGSAEPHGLKEGQSTSARGYTVRSRTGNSGQSTSAQGYTEDGAEQGGAEQNTAGAGMELPQGGVSGANEVMRLSDAARIGNLSNENHFSAPVKVTSYSDSLYIQSAMTSHLSLYSAFLFGLFLNLMPGVLYFFLRLVALLWKKEERGVILLRYMAAVALCLATAAVWWHGQFYGVLYQNVWLISAAAAVVVSSVAETSGYMDFALFRPLKRIFKRGWLIGIFSMLLVTVFPMPYKNQALQLLFLSEPKAALQVGGLIWLGAMVLPVAAFLFRSRFVYPLQGFRGANTIFGILYLLFLLWLALVGYGRVAVVGLFGLVVLLFGLWRMFPQAVYETVRHTRSQKRGKELFFTVQKHWLTAAAVCYLLFIGLFVSLKPVVPENQTVEEVYLKIRENLAKGGAVLLVVDADYSLQSLQNRKRMAEIVKADWPDFDLVHLKLWGQDEALMRLMAYYGAVDVPLNVVFTDRYPTGLVLPHKLRKVDFTRALREWIQTL